MYLKEAVFYHPGLRRISITGAVFTGFSLNNSKRLAPASRSTQLEELILLNCDIGPEAISEILTYPRALKRFTFKGEETTPMVGIERSNDRG